MKSKKSIQVQVEAVSKKDETQNSATPDSQHLGPLSWYPDARLLDETLDMGYCSDCGSHEPRKAEEGTNGNQ